MTRLTIVLLVVLRLAVGWHLTHEGWKKLDKGNFTSEDYLRESTGPMSGVFHKMAGDPLADRLKPVDPPENIEPSKKDLSASFPVALAVEWDAWFEAFAKHYKIDDDQRKEAKTRLDQRKSKLVEWLVLTQKTISKPSTFGPPVPSTKSIGEWVETYQKKQAELRDYLATDYRKALGTSREDEAKAKVAELRREAGGIRTDLKKDLAEQTAEMRKVVTDVLTEEQWQEKEPMKARVSPGLLSRSFLGWTDLLIPWGLLVLGSCLILGLFSRTTAVFAALLLLSFYVAMPPWPGLPEPPQVEGNYLFINKNLIEVFALLVLASTATGRWFGLDRLIAQLLAKKPATAPTITTNVGQTLVTQSS